ncbi:MAG: hypothetical protein ACKPB7_37840, partial [Sphaerospermopsis kisseleviana]
MNNNLEYKGSCFTLKLIDEFTLNLDIPKKQDANIFENMNFFSSLLHSFKPDQNSVWRKQKRLDVEIKGWTANVEWKRLSSSNFKGLLVDNNAFNFKEFAETLDESIKNITVNVKTNKYKFEIGNKLHWEQYLFKSRGREICGLCILYDKEFHTRDELEVTIENQYQPHNISKLNIGNNDTRTSKLYGDP